MQYFAGANTRYGFKSIFEECFCNIERLFLLKGSSGCGKSTFLRRVAAKAKKEGFSVDIINCSADADSLDGVIIHDISVAVADATAPHIMDVRYPCVRESIINFGQFWDEEKLLPQRDNIISLTDKKSNHYKNAYRCLAAVGELEDIKNGHIFKCIDRTRLDETAFRIAKTCINESDIGKRSPVFATAFNALGTKVLPVFENVKTLYRVNGNAKIPMMKFIGQIASECGAAHIVSYSPVLPDLTDAVYFPKTQTLVTSLDNPPCVSASVEKTIATAKFTDAAAMSAVKNRLRGIEKLIYELLSEAQKEFIEAKKVHDEIEKIYIPAMDFKALDDFTFDFIKKIFNE